MVCMGCRFSFMFFFVFFFSSRRRHTRSLCDWSSDVCSSDLSFEKGIQLMKRLATLAAALLFAAPMLAADAPKTDTDRKSTRLNSSHTVISYAVFCLKKKKRTHSTSSALAVQSAQTPTRRAHR